MHIESRESMIMDAAEVALAKFGARRMNMDDIAEVIGMSRPAIYQHFKSKSDLIHATLKRLHTRNFAEIEKRLAQLDDTKPGIFPILRKREEFLFALNEKSAFQNWFLEAPNAAIETLLREFDETYFNTLRDRLTLIGHPEAEVETTARLLVLLAEGIRRTAKTDVELRTLLQAGVTRMNITRKPVAVPSPEPETAPLET